MFKKPLWQTVWTQIRLQSVLGPCCLLLYLICQLNVRQLFAADDFSRRHFQMHIFLGTLKVKKCRNFKFEEREVNLRLSMCSSGNSVVKENVGNIYYAQ